MRYAYLIIILTVISSSTLAFDPFCQGYEAGYVAGFCYGKVACMEPMIPMCPMPHFGLDTYQDGYNRGFLDGLHKRG